jgi:light-regulated signal transduction histidine kinase (bacteriophytochrome)
MVRISVCDQGPGIAPEHLEKVFDRFCQLAGAKKGSGLGLTICRALVEQHRGRIWVESELGRGTKFTIRLPAEATSSQAPVLPKAPQPTTRATDLHQAPLTNSLTHQPHPHHHYA